MNALAVSPDLAEVIERVQSQLGEQLDLLDQEGGGYVRAYAQSMTQPSRVQGPAAPAGMHPRLRKMVQELVGDEMAARRYRPRARSGA